jgi:hypothetical protein
MSFDVRTAAAVHAGVNLRAAINPGRQTLVVKRRKGRITDQPEISFAPQIETRERGSHQGAPKATASAQMSDSADPVRETRLPVNG